MEVSSLSNIPANFHSSAAKTVKFSFIQSKILEYSTKIRGFPEGVVGMGAKFCMSVP